MAALRSRGHGNAYVFMWSKALLCYIALIIIEYWIPQTSHESVKFLHFFCKEMMKTLKKGFPYFYKKPFLICLNHCNTFLVSDRSFSSSLKISINLIFKIHFECMLWILHLVEGNIYDQIQPSNSYAQILFITLEQPQQISSRIFFHTDPSDAMV